MTRDLEIEQAIQRLDPEGFARLAVAVLERDGYPTFSVNTVSGKLRSRKGVPDALCEHANGTYSFLQCTVQDKNLQKKLLSDLVDCFERKPKNIARSAIREVVLACSGHIPPDVIGALKAKASVLRAKVVFCDIDSIKRVIVQKGDDIADDHLGVKVSSQVLSREAFIMRAAGQGAVTDYRTTFRFRDEVVDRAIQALREHPVVLIAGNAGVGKTRTALEVLDRLKALDPELRLLFVRNQGIPFVEELMKRCSDSGRYVVLLDDAQRMGDLQRAMELIVHERGDREVRFLCTVRSIAMDEVVDNLGFAGQREVLKLEPLSDGDLRTFLREEFKIQRNIYVDRILDMARGNPRHAAMVASIILEVGDYKGFKHVAQAFRLYYKDHLQHFTGSADLDRLKVLFSFAFFLHIEGTEYEALILPKLLPVLGMEPKAFWAHARALEQLELINLLGDEGPGLIADESFGTFLVHHMLFEKRLVPLEQLVITFFDGYRDKVVGAINAMMNIFHAEEDIALLRNAVDATLTHFERAGDEGILQDLHEVFHDLDPTRTLQFVDKRISALPSELEGSPILFEDEKHVHLLDAPLRVLRHYGTGDRKDVRTTALELMLAFLVRQPSKGAQVVKALVSAYDLHDRAEATGYQDQRDVAEQLIALSQAGNAAATGLFFGLARNFLSAQSWRVRPTRKRNEVSSRVHIPPLNEPMKALRSMVWRHLFALYELPHQRDRVIKAVRDHLAASDTRGDKKLLAFDAEMIEGFFMRSLDPMVNAHCILVRDLLHHCHRWGIKLGPALARRFTNPTFRFMQKLRYDSSLADRASNDVEPTEVWRQRLSGLGEGASPVEFRRMLLLGERVIRDDPARLHWFGASKAMSIVLVGALGDEPEEVLRTVRQLARKGDPLHLDPNEIIPVLLNAIGNEAVERLIAAGGLRHPWSWWHRFYSEMAKHSDRLAHPQAFEDRCISAVSDGQFMYLSLALHFQEQCPGLLVKLVRVAVERAEVGGRTKQLFHQLFDGRRSELDTIIGHFARERELLQRAFYWAVIDHGMHRKAATIFMELVEQDPSFVARWVQWRYDKSFGSPEPEEFTVMEIWKRPDAAVLMDNAFAKAKAEPKAIVGCDDYLSFLFTPESGQEIPASIIAAQDDWLRGHIEAGWGDEASCQVLMGIVHTLPDERLIALILHYMDQGPTMKLFQRTALEPRLSRIVVRVNGAVQSRIPFLQNLLARCTGLSNLAYRASIEEAIERAKLELRAARNEAIIEGRA